MGSFVALSESDRWALAFFVGTLPYDEADQMAGARLWRSDSSARRAIPDLATLAQTSEHALAQQLGGESARGLIAYLRADPAQLVIDSHGRPL